MKVSAEEREIVECMEILTKGVMGISSDIYMRMTHLA